jgi:CheY-like chemotaxis protein
MSEAGILVPHRLNSNADTSPRILIIDDEAAIRESLETLLLLEGYAVDLAP